MINFNDWMVQKNAAELYELTLQSCMTVNESNDVEGANPSINFPGLVDQFVKTLSTMKEIPGNVYNKITQALNTWRYRNHPPITQGNFPDEELALKYAGKEGAAMQNLYNRALDRHLQPGAQIDPATYYKGLKNTGKDGGTNIDPNIMKVRGTQPTGQEVNLPGQNDQPVQQLGQLAKDIGSDNPEMAQAVDKAFDAAVRAYAVAMKRRDMRFGASRQHMADMAGQIKTAYGKLPVDHPDYKKIVSQANRKFGSERRQHREALKRMQAFDSGDQNIDQAI